MIGSALNSIALTQAIIDDGAILVVLLLRLVALLLRLILLQLPLILLLLRLVLGVVRGRLRVRSGIAGADLLVNSRGLSLLCGGRMGGGHAVGVNPFGRHHAAALSKCSSIH